jgi:regulator of sigma E protease
MGGQDVLSWQEVTFSLMSHLGEQSVDVKVQDAQQQIKIRTIDLTGWKLDKKDQPPLDAIGIVPYRPALTLTIGHVAKGSAANQAGLLVGDKLLAADGQEIEQWQSLVSLVQASPNRSIQLEVMRDGYRQILSVTPEARTGANDEQQGFLGVVPQLESWPEGYIETRHYGPLDSIVLGVQKTYALITLSFDMIGNLITGKVSVNNLSGPVGIAVGAGTSVSYGLVAFLSFLALISVNLGVFNLLPLPVLDGGHLMYYIIELIRKKPVSEKTQELGYKIGAMLLLGLTCFALLNDVSRL